MIDLKIEKSEQYGLDLESLDVSKGVPCWTVRQRTTTSKFYDGLETFYSEDEAKKYVEAIERAYARGDVRAIAKHIRPRKRRRKA